MRWHERLGLTWPLIQAPMAGSQDGALALAVSSAGGLGSLPAAMLDAPALARELTVLQASGRPYNVNFFAHRTPAADAAREATWMRALQPFFEELAVPLPTGPAKPGRRPFDPAMAEVLEVFRPRVVSFHFGLPEPELLQRAKAWGAWVLSSATTVEEALWLEANGVDAVIAQGLEAGGHRGLFLSDDLHTQLGTMALLPQVVQAVGVPVIAAGGIADASGVAGAMALGAVGVQVGTAYLLCPESTTSAVHRAALQSPQARVTALTNLYSGRPARGIVNRLMRELGPLSPLAPAFPLATAGVAPLRSRAESLGSGDFSPLWAGQNVSGCAAVPAGDLTRRLAAGFGEAVRVASVGI